MKYRNDLKRRVLAGLFAGAALCLAAPAVLAASSPVANNQLPAGGQVAAGDVTLPDILRPGGNPNGVTSATITQNSQNAVITWQGGFNIGANATVNFEGPQNFNTLNYDKSGSMSQIYGAINANNNGNIYIVNPAGVEIGNSAQINVGSLYVSNKYLDENKFNDFKGNNLSDIYDGTQTSDAVLMSLGNVNADHVTFDGGRIVIDTERLKDVNGDAKLTAGGIIVHTNNAANVVIGYDAYNNEGDNKGTYEGKQVAASSLATIDEKGQEVTDLKAYMWVEDVEQLQAIDTNLGGNYALRNSIDATATQDTNFTSIGNATNNFNGRFDGLDYNIFNLNIDRAGATNVGLFGVVGNGAVINNVTLVGGSITGGANVGALAGSVQGSAHISNITNSASVTGTSNVGGIVGASKGADFIGLINTGTIRAENSTDASNAGGLIGSMTGGTLGGTSYNLGSVTADGHNVGGLVGYAAEYATIGNEGENAVTVYNRLNVTGAYNVGGIVGAMEDTTVQNVENSGNVSAASSLNETYKYHTDRSDIGAVNKIASINVQIANVGGIAGKSERSSFSKVLNTGNISSSKQENNDFYDAGNVGGIVGSAIDTNITDATNRENEIRGAHNVGGIAGYFANSNDKSETKYTVTNGANDGGDIMATGARATDPHANLVVAGFAQEHIRSAQGGNEHFNIGNMGGIVGYMDGDNVYITASANRGTVHTQEFTGDAVPASAQAANVGGIVGKIDRSKTEKLDKVKGDAKIAAVSNSYNTGDVMGYTGVGGIAGMMYYGEIAGSYNLGNLRTTRQSQVGINGTIDALNMGGIVGDTTEDGSARVLLYDVYNKGQIGDETYNYFGRHVGGIVGRLSGTVEKAYNTGAIYNGYNVVGGIAGWMYTGSINNAFNTGNITVVNKNVGAASQVGGIVGAADVSIDDITLSNVYNLGTLRSFWENKDQQSHNSLGGIIGGVYKTYGDHNSKTDSVYIINAYTTGNLYIDDLKNSGMIGSIYTNVNSGAHFVAENTYYIRPDKNLENVFTDLSDSAIKQDNSNQAINFDDKDDISQYTTKTGDSLFSTDTNKNEVNEDDAWRIYDGSTPILNAFLPNAEDYFAENGLVDENGEKGFTIQYGTAYDPLLTIIKANEDLSFNWQDLGINNDAGLAVYGAGLTLNDFMATGGSGYFGGLIYSDGALTLNAHTFGETHDENNTNVTGDVALGSASQLYGSSVAINADGQVTIYGSVTATGNVQDGTSWDGKKYTENLKDFTSDGSISITGGSVDIYGQLTSADGQSVKVPGINGMATGWEPGTVGDEHEAMSDIGDRFSYTTQPDTFAQTPGNISITANDKTDGHVNVYYGNKGEGLVTTGGNLEVTASGDIYMDSDLSIGGDLTLNAGQITNPDGTTSTATDSEAVLDISNIGKVQAANDADPSLDNKYYLHKFMHHFENNAQDGGTISFTGGESKIAVDMWDEEINEGKGGFNLDKFDKEDDKFVNDLNNLNFTVRGDTEANAQKYTYIWISTGEQLAGIQQYKDNNPSSSILNYNFALKNDIDASDVTDYEAIGTGAVNGYTGVFDGRDNRIIGLDTTKTSNGTPQTLTNAGIFDTIGADGIVEDLRVYSGRFTGTGNAGAVAGVNYGNISNVTAFGNVVQSAEHAGGIVGTNGTVTESPEKIAEITNVSAIGTATADGQDAVAGGIAGTNSGTISDSSANSAVNSSAGGAGALGGVAGVNEGTLDNVDSLGVTTGLYELEGHNSTKKNQYSDNVGGIAGTNSGAVTNAYNESIVSGRDNVGGILGVNNGASVSNVANASSVTGEADSGTTSDYVGGLVGDNEGSITNGRNNGEITGNNYVGGLVGKNGTEDSILTNLVNDESAAIIGDKWVGGIAGANAGTIKADGGNDNLINRGTITGQMYVGGVAGENTGTIANTHNDVELHVRYKGTDNSAKYFGGVAGINGHLDEATEKVTKGGTITDATNTDDIIAPNADYVGGIVGWNPVDGKLEGMGNSNEGRVEGNSFVGGVAGLNEAAIDGSKTEEGMVGIENSGVVIAHNGGAGGIFGHNTGNIQYAEITNNGIVSGTYSDENGLNGTGGLIGVNSGNVTHSSLKNEIGGKVTGIQNVGGLIGVNTGTITGGRDENDGYYKYQIYNNGTIQAGTWKDEDKDGIVDEEEFATAAGDSQNIGGLIGTNEAGATVTAGYNTGVINAGGSSNVGGIAGTNAGTLDQVFNTVITADGKNQIITGGTNVGGISGNNTGTISNAYNTTSVTGTTDTGAIAGNNAGSISNVYGFGSLVGNGSVSNGYNLSEAGSWTHSSSYEGFDFDRTNADGTESIWKIYEGSTNPLLKVFLTKVTVNPDKLPDFAADGSEHKLNVGDLIQSGALTAPDGIGFDAFEQNPILIQSNGHSAMGTYDDWLYSMQIAAGIKDGIFNPNLLGYDIDLELGIGLPPDTVEPPVNEHWNFLFDDNPWDRNRDFRERKANIHFIAGGMTL